MNKNVFAIVTAAGLSASMAAADITFEGFAPTGDVVNVDPGSPHIEAGFMFMPTDNQSAVFDAAVLDDMPGNSSSSFFGWAPSNTITMSRVDAATFSLFDLLLGPSTIGGGTASITLEAFFFGGGTATLTYTGLTTATLESPNWTNLVAVQFTTSDHAAMDNLTTVPTPGAAAMLGLGGLATLRRRRK